MADHTTETPQHVPSHSLSALSLAALGVVFGDIVGHLLGFDTVPLAYFCGPDACHFAGAHGLENRRRLRGELKSIAVTGRHDSRPTASLLVGDRGREEIVGLVTGRLSTGKSARSHELRQDVKLVAQLGVELTSALVGLERPVTIGRHVERIPTHQHRPEVARSHTVAAGHLRSRHPCCRVGGSTWGFRYRRDAQMSRRRRRAAADS